MTDKLTENGTQEFANYEPMADTPDPKFITQY